MKNLYTLLFVVFCLLLTNKLTAQGEACENPINATVGTNTFTGGHNSDQWFSFTATQTGKITISSCSLTSEDTYVKIYGGGICIPLIIKAENDDHCNLQSQVAIIGTTGNDYAIVWGNKSSAAPFDWTIVEDTWSQGEICSDPFAALEGNTNLCNHSAAGDQWFSYVAPGSGTIKVSTCGLTTENTSVRIYDDCSGIQLDGNDDFCSIQSEVEFACTENTTYLVQWEGLYTSGSYNWNLTYNAPTSISKNKHDYKLQVVKELNHIKLELPANLNARINIHSMLGNIVSSKISNGRAVQVDCSDLAEGIYIVSVSSELGVWNEKIYWKK
ncbi:T9SS type A sorting domain-containing protein [Carboxylicivirga sp. N1Y90]|uniref:T9SS type A sorting domain-containing protein n=1 Tax=Carboxylicivirga fragile TaxID=3417571 RepID=UPI003D34F1A0|nr:T9SS type A sorting domain-containing protein [Marinilabiliaceae bacterium N1Y90]